MSFLRPRVIVVCVQVQVWASTGASVVGQGQDRVDGDGARVGLRRGRQGIMKAGRMHGLDCI